MLFYRAVHKRFVTHRTHTAAASSSPSGLAPGPADATRPWLATLKGGVVLVLISGLPILGWFLLLPAIAAAGTGAVGLGLVFKLRPRESTAADAADPVAQVA